MKLTAYQRGLENRIRRLARSVPPDPWVCVGTPGIGGLFSVGYGDESDLLLVVSASGRGVFDCITGDRLARDHDESQPTREESIRLESPGIGPLEGRVIRVAGLNGGGMPLMATDGWHLAPLHLDFVTDVVILERPGADLLYRGPEGCWKVYEGEGIRACGFSPTGRTYVIAEGAHTLHIFSRGSPRGNG